MNSAARLVVTLFLGMGLCCSLVWATDINSDSFVFQQMQHARAQREGRRGQRALWRARHVPFTFGQTTQDVQADLQAIVEGINFTMPLPEQLRVLFANEEFRNYFAHEEQAERYEVALLLLFFDHYMADFFQVRSHMVQQERYTCRFPRRRPHEMFVPHAYVPVTKILYVRRFQDDQFYSYNLAKLDSNNPNIRFSRVDDQETIEHLSRNTLPGMQVACTKAARIDLPEFKIAVVQGDAGEPGSTLMPGVAGFFSNLSNNRLLVFNTVPFLYVFAAAGADQEENDHFLLFDGTSLYVLWGFAQMLHNMNLLDAVIATAFARYCGGRNTVQLDRSYEPFLEHIDPRVLDQINVQWIDE